MANYTAKKIAEFLEAANSDLGSNKYKGDDMIPDYAKAVIIGQQLQKQLASAQGALKERTKDEIHALIEKYGDPQYKTSEFALYDVISVAQQFQAENKRLTVWIDNLEMSAEMESDSSRLRKFKAIKDGKTLEQVLKGT